MPLAIPEGLDMVLNQETHSNASSEETAKYGIDFRLHGSVILLKLVDEVLNPKCHRLDDF